MATPPGSSAPCRPGPASDPRKPDRIRPPESAGDGLGSANRRRWSGPRQGVLETRPGRPSRPLFRPGLRVDQGTRAFFDCGFDSDGGPGRTGGTVDPGPGKRAPGFKGRSVGDVPGFGV